MASDSNAEQGGGGGGGGGEDRDGRRFPPTMEGLLRFSIEHTSDQADSPSLQPQEMTEERREFLRSALAEATVDPIQVIKRSLAEMQELLDREERQEEEEEEGEGDGEEAASQRLQALLENVTDWCNDIDLANDLHKIGGFALFPRLLAARAAGVRSRAAELVATVAQNNPYTQAQLLAQGALPTLLRLTDDDAAGDEVRVKALFAISCVVFIVIDCVLLSLYFQEEVEYCKTILQICFQGGNNSSSQQGPDR
ncbi:PREDICTED: hsp70-binding protein 1-like [Priapulus caudatus]|uniref:Hsp70-binding protein 1-like n=1 Tax=Priapulus caudatus TaxID=37621 RepID=A0ABM1EZL6_PRICU|nr:PREDICTED: hsp70-binding protein 1-like [Priapulus caudatus]